MSDQLCESFHITQQDLDKSVGIVSSRHALNQLRGEISRMAPKRNSPYPKLPNDPLELPPVSRLQQLDIERLQLRSAELLKMVINYIALDVFQGYYPKGDLCDQIRAKVINNQLICQYCPDQCSKYDIDTASVFSNFLAKLCTNEQNAKIMQFNSIKQLIKHEFQISSSLDVEQEIQLVKVNKLSELTELQQVEDLVMLKGAVMTKAQMVHMIPHKEFSPLLQHLLAHCINEMIGVKTSNLPRELADYLNGRQLPASFLEQISCQGMAIKQLKLVLGVYPDDFPQVVYGTENGTLKENKPTCLPWCIKKTGLPWIDQRIQQITYIFTSITEGEGWLHKGSAIQVPMGCTAIQLVKKMYE